MNSPFLRPAAPRVRGDATELRRLIRLRDATRTVLAVQAQGGSDGDLASAQQALTARYDEYRSNHGPLNRDRLTRTGRLDPDTGEEVLRRVRPRSGGFHGDPDWPLVAALEVFDDDTHTARPAPLFTQRVIDPPRPRLGVDTPAEAIAVSLDETSTIDLDRVADLLGVSPSEGRGLLHGLAWTDAATGQLVPTASYLSGNIRDKLQAARVAAEADPAFQANVEALTAVLPRQLEPGEIAGRLGAPRIPAEDVEAFCEEVLGARVEVEFLPAVGRWATALRVGRRGSVSLSSE